MQPPVVRVAAPFDELSALEVVDDGDHPARQQAKLVRQRLLAAARLRRDRPQDAGPRRVEVQLGHAGSEPVGRMVAELGEQEGDSALAGRRVTA